MLSALLPVLASTFQHGEVAPGGQATSELPWSSGVAITQNADPTTLDSGMSVACTDEGGGTRDTGWWRVFDLGADHGLTGAACVQSVDYGIENAVGTQSIELYVGCLPGSPPGHGATLDLELVNQVASHSQPQPDGTLEFFNIDGSGCCDADSESLVIGLISDDCAETDCGGGPGSCCQQLLIGANSLGETAANLLNAPDCGVDSPVDATAICFECSGMVMVVHLDATVADVPAVSSIGALLTVLLLLGSSAYFLSRRATN